MQKVKRAAPERQTNPRPRSSTMRIVELSLRPATASRKPIDWQIVASRGCLRAASESGASVEGHSDRRWSKEEESGFALGDDEQTGKALPLFGPRIYTRAQVQDSGIAATITTPRTSPVQVALSTASSGRDEARDAGHTTWQLRSSLATPQEYPIDCQRHRLRATDLLLNLIRHELQRQLKACVGIATDQVFEQHRDQELGATERTTEGEQSSKKPSRRTVRMMAQFSLPQSRLASLDMQDRPPETDSVNCGSFITLHAFFDGYGLSAGSCKSDEGHDVPTVRKLCESLKEGDRAGKRRKFRSATSSPGMSGEWTRRSVEVGTSQVNDESLRANSESILNSQSLELTSPPPTKPPPTYCPFVYDVRNRASAPGE
ncbi:uncharacterized protein MYCGRDRAFT_97618 [Zymoseptoria tritici IPO323]|uniref:Uncharacterized protein n=1 Tax=Zymoseptoria tritici (strain CBS 115943 / IPO323) TaxID=336722 RepID=F9XR16_ZYMTI|nr:uncharacterized protein MYCGRDRAFT_97618 [Zymoseptoria tritici IPO323]EGP82367.1 hypothetical protein MYCGRDRAFT_97618 [Zymoseptoria tritici IPO323]